MSLVSSATLPLLRRWPQLLCLFRARVSGYPFSVTHLLTPSSSLAKNTFWNANAVTQRSFSLPFGNRLDKSAALVTSVCESLLSNALWHIKRTFQPSIQRKKRKTGFLVRLRTVGGRRMLARRRAKGRHRLGGGI